MIGEKEEVDIGSVTVIDPAATTTAAAMTTEVMVVMMTVADTETTIVIEVVGMILTGVAMTEVDLHDVATYVRTVCDP